MTNLNESKNSKKIEKMLKNFGKKKIEKELSYLIGMGVELCEDGRLVDIPYADDQIGRDGSQNGRRQRMEEDDGDAVGALRNIQNGRRFVGRCQHVPFHFPQPDPSVITSCI